MPWPEKIDTSTVLVGMAGTLFFGVWLDNGYCLSIYKIKNI